MEEMAGYVGRSKRFKVDDGEQVEHDGEDMIEKLLRESEADLPYDDNEDDTRSLSSLFPDRLDDNSEDEVMFIDNGQSMSQGHQTRVIEQSTPQKRPPKNNFRYPSSRSRAARAGALPSIHNDGTRGTVKSPKNDADINSNSKPDSLSTIALQAASSVVKPKPQWGGFFSPDSFQLSTTTTTTTTSLGVAYSPQNPKRRSSVAPSSSPSPSASSIRRGTKTHTPSEIPDNMIGSLTHIVKPPPQQQETPSADDDLFEEDDVIAIASPSLSRITGSFDTPGDDGPPDTDPPSDFGPAQGAAPSTAPSSALTPPINGPTPQSEVSELGDEDQVIGVAVSPAVPVQQQQQQHSHQQQSSRQQHQPQHQQSRHYPRGGGSTERAHTQIHPQSRQTHGYHAKGSTAAAPAVVSHTGGVPKRPMFVLASSYLGGSKWARNGSGGRSGSTERGGTTPRDGDGEDSVDSPIF